MTKRQNKTNDHATRATREISLLKKALVVAAFVIPALVIISLLLKNGVGGPIMDEWGVVSYYRNLVENGFDLSALLTYQNNEHRIVIPVLIQSIIWTFTRCNDLVVLILMQLMLLATIGVVVCYFRQQNKSVFYLLPIVPMAFSLQQGNIQFWPTCFMWVCYIMFSIITFYCYHAYVEKQKISMLIATVVFGVLSTYSASSGLLIWIALLSIIFARSIFEKCKLLKKDNLIIMLSGIICWCAYFHNWSRADASFASKSVISFVKTFIPLFGNPFFGSNDAGIAWLFGAAVFSGFILLVFQICKRKQITRYIFPLLTSVYFLGSMMLVSYGRSSLPGISFSSQYSLTPAWFLVGFYLLALEVFLDNSGAVRVGKAKNWAIFLYLLLFLISLGKYETANSYMKGYQAAAYAVQHYDQIPSEMWKKYVHPGEIRYDDTAWMKENKLSLFAKDEERQYPFTDYVIATREESPALPEVELSTGAAFVDGVNGQKVSDTLTLDSGKGMDLSGWALDDANQTSPSAVYVELAGMYYKLASVSRPDVAQHFENEEYTNSGVRGFVSTYGLEPNTYSVELVVVSGDGESYYKKPLFSLEILQEE